MGQFTQRPEDPQEWAGLPSEPYEPSGAERLGEPAPVIDALSVTDAPASASWLEIALPPTPAESSVVAAIVALLV